MARRQVDGQLPMDPGIVADYNPLVADIKDAIATGRGVERPIRCPHPDHIDHNASASVNVLKMVWYCYSCQNAGKVDSKAVPKAMELLEMIEPEKAGRTYSPNWLSWFTRGDAATYWHGRFAPWVARTLQMGSDPLTDHPTYPVHTPQGRLAGVGRRVDEPDRKYKYPYRWSASRNLFGYAHAVVQRLDTAVIFLGEGAADAAAYLEVGATAFATYGAGVHLPQVELIARCNPKLVVCAFDGDDAGRKANTRSLASLSAWPTIALDWGLYGVKDALELTVDARRAAMAEAVAEAGYSHDEPITSRWATTAQRFAA